MTVLTGGGADGRWAGWFGVAVTGAVDLPLTAGYAELTPAARAASAHQQDLGYLLRQPWHEPDFALEARWLADRGRLSLHLLGRVTGPTEQAVREAAGRASTRLAGLPGHVVGEPVADHDALCDALDPFAPHAAGLAEVRRSWVTARPARPDAGVPYAAVLPFRPVPDRMPSLLARLGAHPAPVMLTVGLEPSAVPDGLGRTLAEFAGEYARLARPGEQVGVGIYGSARRRLEPDPFAVLAQPLFAEAARRYRDPVFRLRVALASPDPFDDALPAAVGDLLGWPAVPGVRPYAVHRPRDRDEVGLLTHALRTLGVPRWGTDRLGPLPRVLRPLAEIADPVEAAAACWLPAAADGPLPCFDTVPPPEERRAARGQTVYAEGATHNEYNGEITVQDGDFVAGDKYPPPV